MKTKIHLQLCKKCTCDQLLNKTIITYSQFIYDGIHFTSFLKYDFPSGNLRLFWDEEDYNHRGLAVTEYQDQFTWEENDGC